MKVVRQCATFTLKCDRYHVLGLVLDSLERETQYYLIADHAFVHSVSHTPIATLDDGRCAEPECVFFMPEGVYVSLVKSDIHIHRVGPVGTANRQPWGVSGSGAGTDHHRIAQGANAVQVGNAIVAVDEPGAPGHCGNAAVQALTKLANHMVTRRALDGLAQGQEQRYQIPGRGRVTLLRLLAFSMSFQAVSVSRVAMAFPFVGFVVSA